MKLSRITQILVVGTTLAFLTFQANAWQIGPNQGKSEKNKQNSFQNDSKEKEKKQEKETKQKKEQEKSYKQNEQGDEGCIEIPKDTPKDCPPDTNGGTTPGSDDCNPPTNRVPDGGSTVMLLGAALIALGTLPKRKS